jgi:hypothetical protein
MKRTQFLTLKLILSVIIVVLVCSGISSVSACGCDDPEVSIRLLKKVNFNNHPFPNNLKNMPLELHVDNNIDVLQQQIEKEGWSYTVGENAASQYTIDELCGLVEPADWWVNVPFDSSTPRGDLPESFD